MEVVRRNNRRCSGKSETLQETALLASTRGALQTRSRDAERTALSDGGISVGRSCRLCWRQGSDVRRRVADQYGCHTAERECRSLASNRAGRATELAGFRAKKPAPMRSIPRVSGCRIRIARIALRRS